LGGEIEEKLRLGPVVIFSEGFMLYTTKEERNRLSELVRPVLEEHGGFLVFEDSMRYHPELKNESFGSFLEKLSKATGRDLSYITQEEMEQEWVDRGYVVDRVSEDIPLESEKSLPLSGPDLDNLNMVKAVHRAWRLSLKKT
jgi:hypothetical protein